jgi:hypothetical protein
MVPLCASIVDQPERIQPRPEQRRPFVRSQDRWLASASSNIASDDRRIQSKVSAYMCGKWKLKYIDQPQIFNILTYKQASSLPKPSTDPSRKRSHRRLLPIPWRSRRQRSGCLGARACQLRASHLLFTRARLQDPHCCCSCQATGVPSRRHTVF